jgi:hypothetical protein
MSHWYDSQGNPKYTIKGANGKIRPTTLRDARKLNLVPSVTTIMSVEDKPGLLTWKQQQLLKACMLYPYDEEIYDEDFWKRKVITESEMIGKNAAERGTEIHNALEHYYLTGEVNEKESKFILPVIEFMNTRFPNVDWIPEASFTSPLGFGGKVDMHSKGKYTTRTEVINSYEREVKTCIQRPIVLDYKTKDTDDRKKMIAYDQHHMQTAAYANGFEIEDAERYNLFISTHIPGMFELTESTDFKREFAMFNNLLQFWQLKNNYVPEI